MKKKILALACLILIGGFSVFFFGACDKDTNCYVETAAMLMPKVTLTTPADTKPYSQPPPSSMSQPHTKLAMTAFTPKTASIATVKETIPYA